jgi:hypothetical protein
MSVPSRSNGDSAHVTTPSEKINRKGRNTLATILAQLGGGSLEVRN